MDSIQNLIVYNTLTYPILSMLCTMIIINYPYVIYLHIYKLIIFFENLKCDLQIVLYKLIKLSVYSYQYFQN